jgi:hypothetical protein
MGKLVYKDLLTSTFTQARCDRGIKTWRTSVLPTKTPDGLPLFSELVWFAYKVSGVMCSEDSLSKEE